jgi:hypothetical protein
MNNKISKFPKHACQGCGAERKLVETLIDDEFIWDESCNDYVPNGYTEDFEHTGNMRCGECGKDWTGK